MSTANYDVYLASVHFTDSSGKKERPVVLFKVSDESYAILEVFGVFSYKDKFEKDWYKQRLYEVKDWKEAGLKTRSFVDVSTFFETPLVELMQSEQLGRLTNNDIMGLINQYNKFNE